MKTGFRGTFVISWAQTELDGLEAASVDSLSVGATWRWQGEAMRVDGPSDVLVLGQSEEVARLRRHAARVVRRVVHVAMGQAGASEIPKADDPVLAQGFAVTDGVNSYTASIVELPGHTALLVFTDQMPPEGLDLWVTQLADQSARARRTGDAAPHVICFTPDTLIGTPSGPTRVGDLDEDDVILTKDDGPQPIRWIGSRRISGARLVAMPELRPVRIKTNAFGDDRPDGTLLVSPEHRLVLKGPVSQDLFGTDEVLVAAKDLLNDHSVTRDYRTRSLTYIHILLDRHQIVFANGLETETFHPATMPIEAVAQEQRSSLRDRLPDLSPDGSSYGPFARRMLSRAESAIMMHSSRSELTIG